MTVINSLKEIVSIALQLFLVVFLLLGPVRRYFIVFLYSAVYLFTTTLEIFLTHQVGTSSTLFHSVYWADEIVLDTLLFTMVIILTLQASAESPLRTGLAKMLAIVAGASLVLPFVLNHPYFTDRWFRHASQILTFGGAIMNLALWTALIGSKKRDPQLMLVSAGLGIAVTGQAIFWGLRLLTRSPLTLELVRLLNVVTYIAGLAIWCWAFRPTRRQPAAPAATVALDA